MAYLESIQLLNERIRKSGPGMADLEKLLDDYKALLTQVTAAGDEYRKDLRRLQEELPDLQRLVGRKHDAILKGRLQDAIVMMKKKVEAIEQPTAEAPEPQTADGADSADISIQEEPKRFRNIPKLGMD